MKWKKQATSTTAADTEAEAVENIVIMAAAAVIANVVASNVAPLVIKSIFLIIEI